MLKSIDHLSPDWDVPCTRAPVARLSNTLRDVTAELDAIQRQLIEPDHFAWSVA